MTARPHLLGLMLCVGMAACSPKYEIDRPGTWKPTGANDANLQAMVANPLDLQSGASASTERSNVASRAVTRLLTDRRRQLLNATISRVSPGQDSNDSGSSASSGTSGNSGAQ